MQEIEYGKVFAGLGHDPLIGSDDQQRGIDSADARQHVLDKIAVAGYVHDADFLTAGQGQPGETEINGHLAFLFFF